TAVVIRHNLPDLGVGLVAGRLDHAELFADRIPFDEATQAQQRVDRLLAKRSRVIDLLTRCRACRLPVGRTIGLLQVARQGVHRLFVVRFRHRGDGPPRRPAGCREAENAVGDGPARAAVALSRVAVGKHEGSRQRPLPRLRGVGKAPRVGVVEADGAPTLHETGAVYSGRTQLGRRRASRSERQLLAGPSWNQTSPFGSTLRSLLWRSCRKARRTG